MDSSKTFTRNYDYEHSLLRWQVCVDKIAQPTASEPNHDDFGLKYRRRLTNGMEFNSSIWWQIWDVILSYHIFASIIMKKLDSPPQTTSRILWVCYGPTVHLAVMVYISVLIDVTSTHGIRTCSLRQVSLFLNCSCWTDYSLQTSK